MNGPEDEQTPPSYVLRLTPRARADIDAAEARFLEIEGEEIADEWKVGLLDAIAVLARFPRRYLAASENARFRQEVRQMTYRRRPGSAAYRIIFTVIEQGDDAPVVRILHIRHGTARPITRTEARQIEAGE